MKKNLKLIIFLGLIIIIAAIWQWSSSNLKSDRANTLSQITGQQTNEIKLTFSFADDNVVELDYPYAENLTTNLLAITQSAAEKQSWAFEYKDYPEMGALVTKINDKNNGQEQKYWQYFVNNQQPMLSADKFVPKNGDQIEWRFAESKF